MLDAFANRLAELMREENLSQRKLACMINCQSKSLRLWLNIQRKGITYYKLAKSLGIGQTTLKRWFLNGSMPEITILIKISKLLDESLDDLFGRGISLDG